MFVTAVLQDRPEVARVLVTRPGRVDRVFRGVSRASGATVVTVMSLVGLFLVVRATQALDVAGRRS